MRFPTPLKQHYLLVACPNVIDRYFKIVHKVNSTVDFEKEKVMHSLNLGRFLGRPALQLFRPRTKVRADGFSITVKRQDGCVLRTRPKDAPEGTPYGDAGVDEHFKVIVVYLGGNSLYPNLKTGTTWEFLLTNALSRDSGFGMVGAVHYCSPGVRFRKLEIEEAYDRGGYDDFGSWSGGPKNILWFAIHTNDGNGPMKLGLADRPA